MLFILVLDVLKSLITKASEHKLLQPILTWGGGQIISLYDDDVVMFLQPCTNDMALVKEILKIFGKAPGLVTNICKCSVTPIQFG